MSSKVRWFLSPAVLLAATLSSATLSAQGTVERAPESHRGSDVVEFLTGAALGFLAHEGGHLVMDLAFDAHPRITGVHFGGVPFFAIDHSNISSRREFAVSSAGFWVQEGWNEYLLTKRPDLRHEHAPLAKGALAFNILTSIGYGVVALAKAGPIERDTRGMADSVGMDERAIAAVVMLPAVLDGYRYFKPDVNWAKWASRAAKAGSVLLIVKKPAYSVVQP
jgi:hypothetical protein